MIESAAGGSGARWKTHRPLDEAVLESAEEEMGLSATSSQSAPNPGNGLDTSGLAWGQLREQIVQQVKDKPARSAMLALGAGAIVAWLLRGVIERRKQGR